MKPGLTLLFSVFFLFQLQAQNTAEVGYDVMKFDKKWVFNQDSTTVHLPMSDSVPRPLLGDLKLNTGLSFNEPPFRSSIINLKVPKFTRNFDYSVNTYSLIPLNSISWITTARINSNYIGMGGLSSAGAQYNWLISDVVTYSGGATFSKYNIYNSFENNLNLNSQLRFQLSDRFFFNVFGNYSTSGNKNTDLFRSLNSSMFPQNNYGGSFEFKVTDKWGIMSGVEREFDPFRGKWVTKPFIVPVFYSK